MRVLLIEDHAQLAGLVSRELHHAHGWQVTAAARDPLVARAAYRDTSFDLAIVDLLHEHLIRDFDERRAAGTASLTSKSLLISGLAAVT